MGRFAYLPTKLGSFGGFHVGKYTSPIEHLGLLHEKIKPKNWEVASPLVMQGRNPIFFLVVSSRFDYGKKDAKICIGLWIFTMF